MTWECAYWQEQTNTDNVLGSSLRTRRAFRYVEIEAVRTEKQVANGIEQSDFTRALKSDTGNLIAMRAGDDIIFASGEKRTVQDVKRKPSAKGGRSYAFTILIK